MLTAFISCLSVFVCIMCCAVGVNIGKELAQGVNSSYPEEADGMIDLSKIESITSVKECLVLYRAVTYAYGQAYRKYDSAAVSADETEDILEVITILGRELDRIEDRIKELEQ